MLIDQSSFTKFEISGPGAGAFLQRLAVADVDREPGTAAYTQLCNTRGGMEADVTVMRHGEDQFWLITGSGFGVRDGHWIRTHMPNDDSVRLQDISSTHGVINLSGPKARAVLQKVTDDDVSNAGFPFMSSRKIHIGHAQVVAFRVTYIGELGWELYIPIEYVLHVYELLSGAGQEFDITNIGYRAIDSLRLEKRYLGWGTDITPDYNPFEAGLQFCINWNKGDFIGASALDRIKQDGVKRKLICLVLEQPLPVFGGEAIYADGKVVGQTTSGNFGYTVGASIVIGYVPVEYTEGFQYEVESFTERSPATLVKGSAYDPKRARILC